MTGLREYLENLTDDVFEQDEIESHLVVSKMQEMGF